MKWQDLELFECSPDLYAGKDKDGNEYGIGSKTGELKELPKGTIKPHWNYASIEEVSKYIENGKRKAG